MHNSIRGGTFHGPVVQADTANVTVGARPPTIAGLPPLTAAFTGRDQDLAALRTLLTTDGSPTVTVTGLGGIGKTTLAIAAGHALLAAGHVTLAVLVDLRGYDETPAEGGHALDTLLRALGVPAEHIPPDPETRAALYRTQLERHEHGVLVIADNASAADQVRLLAPPSPRHRLLVTSRETLPSLGARLHRLGVLAPGAAIHLLDTAVRAARPDDDRIAADPGNAHRTAELCGHLPLALRLAAAQLVLDPHLRPVELADDLADGADRLDLLHDGDTGIRLTLDRSYRRLTPELADLFRLLALNPGPDIATEAAAALIDRKPRETRSLLARLAGTALIEQNAEGGRWYLHDLTRVYAAERSRRRPEDGKAALRRLLEYYATRVGPADAQVRELPICTMADRFGDRNEALVWLERERVNLTAAVQSAAVSGLPRLVVHLSSSLTPHLIRWFRTDDALTVTATALEAAADLGQADVDATVRSNRGLALEHARRFAEAAEAHRHVGAICRALGDPLGEAGAYVNLGNALWGLRQFGDASEIHRHALAIVREERDRPAEARSLINLGGLLAEVRRFDEAVELLRAGREILAEVGDRNGEATAWASVGVVLGELRRFEESIDAHQRALDAFRALGDRHSEAKASGGLGAVLLRVQRYEEAVEAGLRACAVFEELGDRHSEVLARRTLGAALRHVRRPDEALASERRALAIDQELGDRFAEAESATRLGNLLQSMKRHDEAEAAHREALVACRDVGDRESEAIVLTNLGNCLFAMGRFEDAALSYEAGLGIDRELDDRHHEAAILCNAAAAYGSLGRYEEGVEALYRSRDLFQACGDAAGAADAQANLGAVLTSFARFAEAEVECRQALSAFQRLGKRHGEAVAWCNLGDALRGAGAVAEAEEAYARGQAILAGLEAEGTVTEE
ncbi:tetratricopeptide repeat protein [Kitasatospora sp. NPDC097691]|uniref:tetratricopeptide repeat protein n=1 Tax=Kitasatospora sp. NPDC097691 TaxID=3157231 RepID=UPI00332B5118